MAMLLHTLGHCARVPDQGRYLQLVEKKSAVVKGVHDRSLQKRFREAIIRPDMPPEDQTIG
jgi:hypothetical protein